MAADDTTPESMPAPARRGRRRKEETPLTPAPKGLLVMVETEPKSGLYEMSDELNISDLLALTAAGRAVVVAPAWQAY